MNKEQAKLNEQLKGMHKYKPNIRYDLSKILNDETYKGQYFTTDKKGNIKSFQSESEVLDQEMKKFIKTKTTTERKKKIKETDKTKTELAKLKSDPTYLRQKLDELYLNHDKKKSSYDELLDEEGLDESEISKKDPKHAKIRKLQNQYRTSINKLYKTATTYSHITGEDEKARAFQHVVGQRFEEELPRDVPTPQFQPRQDIKKVSDEELLKQLQRK